MASKSIVYKILQKYDLQLIAVSGVLAGILITLLFLVMFEEGQSFLDSLDSISAASF